MKKTAFTLVLAVMCAAAPDGGFDWYDAKDLTFEGQARVGRMEDSYVRCPFDVKGKIQGGVFGRGRTSMGMTVRFIPHSDTFRVKWTKGRRALINFPQQAVLDEFKVGVPKGAKVEKDLPPRNRRSRS